MTPEKRPPPPRRSQDHLQKKAADYQGRERDCRQKRPLPVSEIGTLKERQDYAPSERLNSDITIPDSLIQPTDLAQEWRCNHSDGDTNIQLRLFYGIASPDAFLGLQTALKSTPPKPQSLQSSPNALQTIRALDQGESSSCRAAIWRRAYLAHLVALRDSLVESYHQANDRRNTPHKQSEGHGKVSSKAMERLMQQAYPDLNAGSQRYQQRRDQLKNRLRRGRKWYILRERFSAATFALIPHEGLFACADSMCVSTLPLLLTPAYLTLSSVEDMKEDHFIAVLRMLAQHRSTFMQDVSKRLGDEIIDAIFGVRDDVHFKLEEADEDSFGSESYDSDSLISLYERVPANI